MPARLWFFVPRAVMPVTTPRVRSTVPRALFSWKETHARVGSAGSNATYSGSRSWATVAPGPKMRTPALRNALAWELNDVRLTCLTAPLAP